MIWLKKAKSILAAFAAGDIDCVEESLSSDIRYETGVVLFYGFEVCEYLIKLHDGANISYQINRSAYNDKTIFLEATHIEKKGYSQATTDEVHIFEFDNYGKVKFWRVY